MKKNGFTLIELLVVIGIIAILATVILVAVNPSRQFSISRDTTRRNDLYQVLSALHQYAVDYGGAYPTQIQTNNWIDIGSCGGCLNLEVDLVPTYIPIIPYDPLTGDSATGTTDYVLAIDSNSRLVATASSAEVSVPLSLMR